MTTSAVGTPRSGLWTRQGRAIVVETVAEPAATDGGHCGCAHHEPESEMGSQTELADAAVRRVVALGVRDENKLTNAVFAARHPERAGRAISRAEPNFRALSSEWLGIRNRIVRPALGPTRPGPALADGPLALVATQLPGGSRPSKQYGVPETIAALVWVAERWRKAYPAVRFSVGDISKRGGGQLGGHKSHRVGLDVDVTLLRGSRVVKTTNADYARDRPLVQELVNLIRANPVLPTKLILFNDSAVKGVSHWPGHENHLHLRFCRPAKYRASLDVAKVHGAAFNRRHYDC